MDKFYQSLKTNRVVYTAGLLLALIGLPSPVLAGVEDGALNFTSLNLQTKFQYSAEIVGEVVKIVVAVAGIGFVIYFILGAIKYITSNGDVKAVQAARKAITAALVGIILTASVFAIMSLLKTVFGITAF